MVEHRQADKCKRHHCRCDTHISNTHLALCGGSALQNVSELDCGRCLQW
jgi:hypothetical protein